MSLPLQSSTRFIRRISGLTSVLLCLGALADPTGAQELPTQGERIRVELDPALTASSALTSTWEATFLMFQDRALVATGDFGGPRRVPFDGIQTLQVERDRSTRSAIVRGAAVGAAFGLGMWGFLRILCRSGCGGGSDSAWLPAAISGTGVAVIVGWRSASGGRWVQVSLPR